jgi:hypothetical protein
MYTRYQQQLICLHGSISAFAVQQNRRSHFPTTKKAAGMTGGL